MRQELKQAAAHRLASVPQNNETSEKMERDLIRALILPEADEARRIAHIEWWNTPNLSAGSLRAS